jgi:succinyl-diaminopimelate desuccinylase
MQMQADTTDEYLIDLICQLIKRKSITPEDAGCQQLIIDQLQHLGFDAKIINSNSVSNLILRKGKDKPVFAFAGHTDVVPAGNEALWKTPPFKPTINNDTIYGRGVADMKGSIAAMIAAIRRFIDKNPNHSGSIAMLITSDEEGEAKDGTAKIVEYLKSTNEFIDYCLVGEPSSSKILGDTIKVGRRGSLHGFLTIHGTTGHIAYPQYTDNPIHKLNVVIDNLTKQLWDNGNEFFDPTQFQIWHIQSSSKVSNVVPSSVELAFNFRYSSEITANFIKTKVATILDKLNIDYNITWQLSGKPFLTQKTTLINAVSKAINQEVNLQPQLSTSGGTSDGRFIAPLGTEVVELGPINASIHQPNEELSIPDILKLAKIYETILVNIIN